MIRNVPVNPVFSKTQESFLCSLLSSQADESVCFHKDHFKISDDSIVLEFPEIGATMEFKYEIKEDQKSIFKESEVLKLFKVNVGFYVIGEVETTSEK